MSAVKKRGRVLVEPSPNRPNQLLCDIYVIEADSTHAKNKRPMRGGGRFTAARSSVAMADMLLAAATEMLLT